MAIFITSMGFMEARDVAGIKQKFCKHLVSVLWIRF